MAADVLDAHQHFWHYTPETHGWIGYVPNQRDFLPADLQPELQAAGVDGCIAVEARPSIAETEWLLSLAEENPWIRGVVGWAPLLDGDAARPVLERLAQNARLRGIRFGAQSEPLGFLGRGDLNAGIALLREFGIAFDILIYERQLPDALALVDRHPAQPFVLDHLAKPRIRDGVLEPWATHLRDLARRPNVYCKLSGMVTEADPQAWTEAQLRPYVEVALEAFGSARLMFGSDWPVCRAGVSYGEWAACVRRFTVSLSPTEQAAIWGETAREAYGVP